MDLIVRPGNHQEDNELLIILVVGYFSCLLDSIIGIFYMPLYRK